MSGVFLCFLRSDLVRNQQFRLPIAVNAICFSSLVNKPLGVLTMVYCPSSLVSNVSNHAMNEKLFQSNIPSNRWHIARIFQIW